MINIFILFLSIYDVRHCHSLCLKRNALFFDYKDGKKCKLYYVNPEQFAVPVRDALTCSKEVFMSNYYTPESCCVTKKSVCNEICLP